MATNYYVRVWCEEDEEYKRDVQTDTIDDSWTPDGCEAHTIRDFVVEKVEVV